MSRWRVEFQVGDAVIARTAAVVEPGVLFPLEVDWCVVRERVPQLAQEPVGDAGRDPTEHSDDLVPVCLVWYAAEEEVLVLDGFRERTRLVDDVLGPLVIGGPRGSENGGGPVLERWACWHAARSIPQWPCEMLGSGMGDVPDVSKRNEGCHTSCMQLPRTRARTR